MKLYFRSFLLILALYGLVFAVGDAYLARHGASVWVALAFAIGVIGLQYALGPYLIGWFLRIRWDSGTELPVRNREFLLKLCAGRGLKMPRIGIIDSATPNAFTYGHLPSDARVVVTTGLLTILTPEESNAVLAHEMGHVEHYDFIVMTLAALAPLLLYQLYAFTRGNHSARPLAFSAYLAYWVSEYLLMMLSRTREYFADLYSAQVTGDPEALASALVKIAYGIFHADGELARQLKEAGDKEKARWKRERVRADSLALLGISNLRAGESLALAGGDAATAAAVMRWDLVNPWARIYELSSTHPLTALRIRALNRESDRIHQRAADPSPAEPIRWGTFPMELLLWAAPWVCAAATVSIAWVSWPAGPYSHLLTTHHLRISPGLAPLLLMLTGILWALRTWFRYFGRFRPATIAGLMEDVEVSEMRPRAVRLEGTVIGFGVPGAFYCADLVLEDPTGHLFLLYKQCIPFSRLMFALTEADNFIGQQVIVDGWFRRGLRPYLEMGRLTDENGGAVTTWARWVHYGLAAVTMLGALLWVAMR